MRPAVFLRAALLFGATAACAFAAKVQTVSTDSGTPVRIRVTELTDECSLLVKPLRVTVSNDSASTLEYDFTLSTAGNHSVGRRLAVPPNTERSTIVVAPVADGSPWAYATFVARGPGTGGSSRLYFSSSHSGRVSSDAIQVGLSQGLNSAYGGRWKKRLDDLSGSGAASTVAELEPDALSGDWRVYRGLSAFTMTAEEWRTACASPEVRDGLMRFAGQGGRLAIVAGKNEAVPMMPAGADALPFGFGGLRVYRTGASEAMDAFERASDLHVNNPFSLPRVPAVSSSDRPLEGRLPLPAGAGAVVAVIIILFAVVAGPLNLFWLCRGPRRHRMLWTTPAIAVGFSAVIMAYVFVADGTGGSGYRRRLRLRPAGTAWEFLIQAQSSRTGLLLGSDFDVPEASLLRQETDPSVISVLRYSSNDDRMRRFGDHASGDWFRSRFVQTQSLEVWQSERGGVTLTGPDDAPRLKSSVDGTLARVFVRTASGSLRVAENVAPGAVVATRAATAAEFDAWYAGVSSDCSPAQLSRLGRVSKSKGWWYAESSDLRAGSPDTLASIRWKNLPDILVGDLSPETPAAR